MIAPRLALLTVAGALAAAGVTGCAQQSGTSDKKFTDDAGRVAGTIRALDDAYTDEVNDETGAGKVCRELLSKAYVQRLGGNDCSKNVAIALKNADSTEMDVRDVKIQPGAGVATATVRIKVNDDEQRLDTLTLVQEGQTWKFDGSVKGTKPADGKPAVAPAALPATGTGTTGATGASGATGTTGSGATTTPTPASDG